MNSPDDAGAPADSEKPPVATTRTVLAQVANSRSFALGMLTGGVVPAGTAMIEAWRNARVPVDEAGPRTGDSTAGPAP